MFLTMRKNLKNNLAFLPVILLLNFLGLAHLTNGSRKIFSLLYSAFCLVLLLIAGIFIEYDRQNTIVVGTVTYITVNCIYFSTIFLYCRKTFLASNEDLSEIFENFYAIDSMLQATFNIKRLQNICPSQKSVGALITVLLMASFGNFIFKILQYGQVDIWQGIHAMLVFIFSLEILLYCMLCASIKNRFRTLIQYLSDTKPSHSTTMTTFVGSLNLNDIAVKMSQFKDISMIYDRVLEIIVALNESFSALLGLAFGKIYFSCSDSLSLLLTVISLIDD